MRKKIITLIIFFILINFLISGFLIKKKKIEPEDVELKKEDIYSESAPQPSEIHILEKTKIKKEDYILGKEGFPILVVSNFRANNIDPAIINIISDKLQFDILKNGKFRIIDRINLTKLFEEQGIKSPKDFELLKSYCEKLKKININYLISGNLNIYNNTYSLDLLQVNVSNCEIEQIVNVIAKENPANLIKEIDNIAIRFEPVSISKAEVFAKEKLKETEKKPVEPIKLSESDLSSINSQLLELSKKIEAIEKKLDENLQLLKSLDQMIKKNQDEIENLKIKLNEISQGQIDISEGIHADQLYQEALKYPDGSKERANKLLQAIEQDPNNIRYHQKLARTYYTLKDYDNAIKQCDVAININPNDPYNYTLKGATLFKKGEYKDAAILHEKAILLDSTYSSAYYNLALTYEKIDKNIALKKWKEYLNVAQDDPSQQDWIPIAKKRMEKMKVDTEISK